MHLFTRIWIRYFCNLLVGIIYRLQLYFSKKQNLRVGETRGGRDTLSILRNNYKFACVQNITSDPTSDGAAAHLCTLSTYLRLASNSDIEALEILKQTVRTKEFRQLAAVR